MRTSWLTFLTIICFALLSAACRKNNITRQINNPSLPGIDTSNGNPANPSQRVSYNQVPVHERIGDNVGGYYQALPPSYDSSDKQFPLLVFLHGGGELGDGSDTSLPKILKNSITRRLHEKDFPVSFTVNNQSFSFIIISPQFAEWPKVADVHEVIMHAIGKYRVDVSRIYLSGLSMGGGATWEYAGSQYGTLLASIVPMCGASWADSAVAKKIAQNEIPAWAFHNEDDAAVTVKSTTRYARLIAAANPKYPVKVTLWPTGGHDAWTKASDPNYKEEGMNMYEWMLQYVRVN